MLLSPKTQLFSVTKDGAVSVTIDAAVFCHPERAVGEVKDLKHHNGPRLRLFTPDSSLRSE